MSPFQHVQRWPAAVPQLHDYLIATAARLPGKVALVCDGQRLTYAELEASSNALAHALVRRGVARGDRVVIFADNTVQTVIAFWGVLKASAVTAIVNSQVKTDKLAGLLNDCRAAALITDARHTAIFAGAAARSAHLKATLIAGPRDESRTAHLPGVADWDAALAAEPRDTAPPRLNLDIDLASIVYSSGTTGTPKAIMLTHRNMLTAATSISTYLENVEDDVILDVLPLALTYGLYQLITAVKVGARLVLERSFAYPAEVLKRMVEEGVTGLPGVPTMFALLGEMKTLSRARLLEAALRDQRGGRAPGQAPPHAAGTAAGGEDLLDVRSDRVRPGRLPAAGGRGPQAGQHRHRPPEHGVLAGRRER